MKKYRSFSNEFKREIIALIENGALSTAEASRKNNISPSLIDRWRKQIQSNGMKDKPTLKEKLLEKELDKYKKKVGELTLHVDLLKKLNTDLAFTKKLNGLIITGRKSDQSKEPAE
jgi:transposase-like protein